MGGFVALYNYVGYHLLGAPYELSQAAVGWIFVLYLVGTFSSAWMGRLADSLGRARVLWIGMSIMLFGVGMTLAGSLWVLIAGMAVLTFGFFGAHSIASGWVGQSALSARAQASALYLLCYYLGSSIGGSAGGLAYSHAGWPGLVAMVAALLILALISAARLTLAPRPPEKTPAESLRQ
jgi:MFS transporter, YNFM family, putative membrane transport protein